ncbi:hypothetical protein KEJ18_05165 [Candidatus Bathyarchaeota archaeon]|nr:hypothetical protein [Candidatus Bathyarchaeota archaeon]
MSSKSQRVIALSFASFCVWLSFSVLMYIILFINQQEIMRIKVNVEGQLLESLVGWELTRQVLWAALIIPCLVGIFFTVHRLKEKNSTYNAYLLYILYFGFIFAFEYCILRLIWSYQVTRVYEVLLGMSFTGTDAVQNFLFTPSGVMSDYGIIVISTLLGVTAALFFFLVQIGGHRKEVLKEKIVETPEPIIKRLDISIDLEKIRGIGPIMAEKLFKAGIKSLKDLANSDPKKVADALNISTESAGVFINVAKSLTKAQKPSETT